MKTFSANKETCLREFISNDDLGKIRYESITDPDKIESQPNFYIKINPDKTNSTIAKGIGMTKNQLINNLGSISVTIADPDQIGRQSNLEGRQEECRMQKVCNDSARQKTLKGREHIKKY